LEGLVAASVFIDRERELRALEDFWAGGSAQCIPVTGRRRVGKTFLLEHFAQDKRVVYYRCQLGESAEQLPLLGAALAELTDDPVARAQPPTNWPAVFALIERLVGEGRLLLVLDELPYWVARDPGLPSILQNWWDARGRRLDLMLVLCGSAAQMMERLLTGEAPLAGCITGRLPVRPFDFRAAARLLGSADPVDALAAHGVLGGVPLYLTFFRPERTLGENILRAIASPTARLYVEPAAVFAAHHAAYDATQALGVLRAIARGKHRWSDIAAAANLAAARLGQVMEPLIGDLGLVERILPVTERRESRAYHVQYHLTDNFFRFWFRFIEPNQGAIEFGDARGVVDGILAELNDYLGLPFEAACREWVRLASAAGALPARLGTVGTWWNPDHDLDVVGLDAERQVVVTGECKWRNQGFRWADLQTYLGHVQALARVAPLRPDATHLLFSMAGFEPRVAEWAAGTRARLLTPADLLAPFEAA
jgi:AAA+ ATPase superfamily predicted ATPase